MAVGLSDEQAVADLHKNPDQRQNADEEPNAFEGHIGHLWRMALYEGEVLQLISVRGLTGDVRGITADIKTRSSAPPCTGVCATC